jgi:hypothetical protein
MATTRIKDLSKTATTVASDANIVIDGSSNGTQKITRDNFRQDTADAYVAAPSTYKLAPLNGVNKIDGTYLPTSGDTPKGEWNASTNSPTLADGTGTAGDYYDVTTAGTANLGSGAITYTVGDVVKYNGATWFKIDSVANILDGISTVDPAKVALQIPNVGTAANEVSVNGMLGDLAFQSSDGPSVSNLKASGTTTLTNDSDLALAVETSGQNAMTVNVIGVSPNYIFDVRDDGTSKFRVDGNGNVVIGNIPTSASGLASGTVWSDSGTLKIVS